MICFFCAAPRPAPGAKVSTRGRGRFRSLAIQASKASGRGTVTLPPSTATRTSRGQRPSGPTPATTSSTTMSVRPSVSASTSLIPSRDPKKVVSRSTSLSRPVVTVSRGGGGGGLLLAPDSIDFALSSALRDFCFTSVSAAMVDGFYIVVGVLAAYSID